MKKGLKPVALALLAAMLLFALAACQTGQAASGGASGSAAAPSAGAGSSAPAQPDEMDFTGVKIKIPTYENASAHNQAVAEAINEALGFEIEWILIPSSEGWPAQDRLLAADPTIDVLNVSGSRLSSYLSNGYLMDISGYITDERFPNVQQYNRPITEGMTAPDGKYYALAFLAYGGWPNTNRSGIAIRQDWLAEANLEMPATIEDLDEILAAFKDLYPDKYPMYQQNPNGGGTFSQLLAGSFSEAGHNWWYDEADGVLKHYVQHPDYVKYVEKMKEWYDKGYLHPEFATATNATTMTVMASEEAGVVGAWCTNPINPNVSLKELYPDVDEFFRFVKGTLEGPAGKSINGTSPSTATSFGVNVNCENPDAVFAAIDFFQTEEGYRLATWGIQDLNYTFLNDTVVRASGDYAYSSQYNCLTNQVFTTKYQTQTHYTDAQYYNWYDVWYTEERLEVIRFSPDANLVYDYSTGDNQYPTLEATVGTYVSELVNDIIVGNVAIAEWDARIAELEDITLHQMNKERTEQWDKYDRRVYDPGDTRFLDLSTKPDWMTDFWW